MPYPEQRVSPGLSGGSDRFATVGLLVGGVTLAPGAVLWAGAALAGAISGLGVPEGGLVPALHALGNPADPSDSWPASSEIAPTPLYWGCTLLLLAAAAAAILVGLRLARRLGRRGEDRGLRSRPGLAHPDEAVALAGRAALLRRGPVVRPSDLGGDPAELGYRLGDVRGRELWCSVEDSILLVGPPRMGKGLHLVIPWVLDAPGAVVATSTRPDTLTATHQARARRGPVAVFDPQQLVGLEGGLRWSPVRGCHAPRTAMVRARGLAAGAGFGKGVSDAAFWSGQTETALRCLLHAAALDGRGTPDLYRWSLSPVLAEQAVSVLSRERESADGWSDALDAIVSADPRTRDSIWLGVRQALSALADPQVMESLDPTGHEEFDPDEFLAERGTLFLLAPAVTSASCGPLVAAFLEDVTETARARAARLPGARLDPPLLMALDEIANLTPLPSLPSLMAEGGGTGITTLTVLQSLAQSRHRWGPHAADAIWDAATVKVVLGGLAKMSDLEDVARLLGEVDENTQTISRGRAGERSTSTSVRRLPVMPPSVLRTLPFGSAVLLLRHSRPVVLDLQPWTKRKDAAAIRADQRVIETTIAKSCVR